MHAWTALEVVVCSPDISPIVYVDGLAQDCSNSTANTLELLQFCTGPSLTIWIPWFLVDLANRIHISSWMNMTN